MFKRNISDSRKGRKEGLVSHILLQKGDLPNLEMSVTWVEVEPGCAQNPHCHTPAQVYVIIEGTGRMLVGDEEQDVQKGDCIHIPANAIHGIRNPGTESLVYVTSSVPALNVLSLYPDPD